MNINCDLHLHTCLSPCGDQEMTPFNIANMAVLLGLDAIAVSDHNTAGNVRAVIKAAKENKLPITIVPAIEINTSEEVHILSLFADIDAAEEASKAFYEFLPDIKNNPDIFGQQILMNENDDTIGYEEKLLITALTIDIGKSKEIVEYFNGIAIPAHIDRNSYSIVSNLGLIPSEYDFRVIEKFDINFPYEFNGKVISNSDAHYLENMREQANTFSVEENTAKSIIEYLKK